MFSKSHRDFEKESLIITRELFLSQKVPSFSRNIVLLLNSVFCCPAKIHPSKMLPAAKESCTLRSAPYLFFAQKKR